MISLLTLLALRAVVSTAPAPCLAPNEMCVIAHCESTHTSAHAHSAAFVLPPGKAVAMAFANGVLLKPGRDYKMAINKGRPVVLVSPKKKVKPTSTGVLFKVILEPEPVLPVSVEPLAESIQRPRPKGRPENR